MPIKVLNYSPKRAEKTFFSFMQKIFLGEGEYIPMYNFKNIFSSFGGSMPKLIVNQE